MDPITPTPIIDQATTTAGIASRERITAASDFKSFLTLLTAQLRNQDPLDPLDSTQFVAQLASFSTVEQLIGANERLDALSSALGGDELVRLTDWIGREVATENGVFKATGNAVPFPVDPFPGTERIEVVVSTPEGIVQRRFTINGSSEEGTWDGKNDRGIPVNGQTVRIDLYHMRGDQVLHEERAPVFSRVIGLSDTSDGIRIQLRDGRQIGPDDVSDIRE